MIKILKNKAVTIFLLIVILFGILLSVVLLNNSKDKTDKLLIYTSFYPLYDFTKKIGGDKVEVINLVKAGEEAHHFEPTTQQMVNMQKASLIIINGLGLEGWVNNLSPELKNKVVDTSKDTNKILLDEHDNHNHDTHYDPHIWLSLNNAKIQLKNIKDALIKIDINNASYYESNYNVYSEILTSLYNNYYEKLTNLPNKTFIVSHKAFSYIAHEFGLTQLSLSGIESQEEPDAQTMANIINFINQNNVKVIFYQSLVNQKVANQIANYTNATTKLLHSLEGLTQEELKAGYDYIYFMTKNLLSLHEALK